MILFSCHHASRASSYLRTVNMPCASPSAPRPTPQPQTALFFLSLFKKIKRTKKKGRRARRENLIFLSFFFWFQIMKLVSLHSKVEKQTKLYYSRKKKMTLSIWGWCFFFFFLTELIRRNGTCCYWHTSFYLLVKFKMILM